MNYSFKHKSFLIKPSDLDSVAMSLLYVMRQARIIAKAPMGKRKSPGPLTDLDHLEKGILDAAKAIGIDFGETWGDKIDLSDFE